MGLSISELKEYLSNREYILFQKYFMQFGIGQEAEYVRSANLLRTIYQALGEKKAITAEDFYPQLSYSNKKKRHSNQLVNWETTEERLRVQLIEAGLYTEEGDPVGYNPNSK